MTVNIQKEWRAEQIAIAEITRYDTGAIISPMNDRMCYDLLVTSPEKGLKYGVELKRSEFARTKNYSNYIEYLQAHQGEVDVPILLVSVNESSEEVKLGIVFSWFHRRALITRDLVLWKSSKENWEKALYLLSISAHVEGPIEVLQFDNICLKKTLSLSAERRDGRRYIADLVYMRKMTPEYKIQPLERNTLQEEMQFYLHGYTKEEYPEDDLDKAIFEAVQEKCPETEIRNQLIVVNTELRDLQLYREWYRGNTHFRLEPQLNDMRDDVIRLLGKHSEFMFDIELYANSDEDRNYFDEMVFTHTDAADGWVEKVLKYRKAMLGYMKLSDIIG